MKVGRKVGQPPGWTSTIASALLAVVEGIDDAVKDVVNELDGLHAEGRISYRLKIWVCA